MENQNNNNSLKVSECFMAVQGEGASVGIPSIFIRLTGCNLMCGGPGGILKKQGKATWWCDTETVWKTGKDFTYEDLIGKFKECKQLDNVMCGRTHLIWTGGEPTMPGHVKNIIGFLDYFRDLYPESEVFSEIETNGTIPIIEPYFYKGEIESDGPVSWMVGPYIQQINCSPKLANSGMSKQMRINKKALEQILDHEQGYLKFVISNEEDIQEIEEDFIKPFNVPWQRVILMPGLDRAADAFERTRFVTEMGKKYGYRSVSRQHVIAYDMTTGV